MDKIERWVMNSGEVEHLQDDRRSSIYAGHPICATRVAKLFGVGPTLKLNDNLVGSDKLGHFFSQGRWRLIKIYIAEIFKQNTHGFFLLFFRDETSVKQLDYTANGTGDTIISYF